ncbi:alpha-(1,3)-fucosyltransferase 7-like [Phymastichus coffea]|uniref:alpha-(1,3)-fucosyltransferase 7-like n=1 Tax=Phymastichus coffea TaxID=108790 RepID=UPI00273ADD2A|nr:alpha-(1,3)-fucosyltransferase 7-like [Phymastichus coffea]
MASQEDRERSAAWRRGRRTLHRSCSDGMRRAAWLVLLFLGCVVWLLYVIATVDDRTRALALVRQRVGGDLEPSAEDAEWSRRRATLAKSISPLANWLLSREGSAPPAKTTNRSEPFVILVWQHGPFLERRHLRRFSRDNTFSPWEGCSVQNCRLTYAASRLHSADAVIFHLHRTANARSLPRRENPDQRWIFLSDESPPNTFLLRNQSLEDYDGLFNWSMTYRIDSDVPVPYGRTVLRDKVDDKFNARDIVAEKTRLVAVLGSNCAGQNGRWEYVAKLKSILGEDLAILGHCQNGDSSACPGHFEADCAALSRFKFYLAFENSNCREYLTEKVFWNAYGKRAVPVIMGARRSDCELLLPPRSYLHVDDFADAASLASRLRYLGGGGAAAEYARLHAWRARYRVLDEHGYFGSASRHYCRVCEALNYAERPRARKVYRRLADFWSTRAHCRH